MQIPGQRTKFARCKCWLPILTSRSLTIQPQHSSTAKIKQIADLKVMTLDETDALIRSFHLDLQKGHDQNGQNDESVEKAT